MPGHVPRHHFQRTKTWKESPDPERDTVLDRVEEVLERFPDRVSPSTSSGLGDPVDRGLLLGEAGQTQCLLATHHRTHGVTYFHGCYSVGDDRLWGVNRRRKGTVNTLAALKSIRAPDPTAPRLHHPGQPLRPQGRGRPPLGDEEQGRAVLHPDLRLLGQPDRSPL